MFNRNLILTILLAFSVQGAVAQQPPAVAQQPNHQIQPAAPDAVKAMTPNKLASEIIRLNEENALLTARLKKLETQEQIAIKEASLNKYGGSMSESSADIPTVKGISGADGNLRATLTWAGSSERVVKKGDKIRGGWSIVQIDSSSVSLGGNGRSPIKLGFGIEPVSSGQPGAFTPQGYPR